MQFGSWWGYRGWKGEGWLRVALFRSICTGRAITWTRWTAEAVSDGREPRGRGWTAPSTWPASYPRYSIPMVRRGEGIVDKFQIPRILEARICEKNVSWTFRGQMKESIESPRSSSLFPDRSRSGMRYFPYSGDIRASGRRVTYWNM